MPRPQRVQSQETRPNPQRPQTPGGGRGARAHLLLRAQSGLHQLEEGHDGAKRPGKVQRPDGDSVQRGPRPLQPQDPQPVQHPRHQPPPQELHQVPLCARALREVSVRLPQQVHAALQLLLPQALRDKDRETVP